MKHSASILYVTGGDPGDMKDIRQAIVLAMENQSSLTVLDVIESLPAPARMLITVMPTGEIRDIIQARRQAQLESLISMMKTDGVDVRVRVRFGNCAREVVCEASAGRYDLVIKHAGKARTDRYLSRNCPCPLQLLNQGDDLARIASRLPGSTHRTGDDITARGDTGMRGGYQFPAR